MVEGERLRSSEEGSRSRPGRPDVDYPRWIDVRVVLYVR